MLSDRQHVLLLRIGLTVGVLALLAAVHCDGERRGALHARTAIVDSVRRVYADSSKAAEQRMAARAPVIAAADAKRDTARAVYRRAAARVVPVTDSTVSIDNAPPVALVPASLVIPGIRVCNDMAAADSIAERAHAAQLADMTADRNAWRDRALLDEANMPKPSRFGFKSGALAGAAFVLTVLHFAR